MALHHDLLAKVQELVTLIDKQTEAEAVAPVDTNSPEYAVFLATVLDKIKAVGSYLESVESIPKSRFIGLNKLVYLDETTKVTLASKSGASTVDSASITKSLLAINRKDIVEELATYKPADLEANEFVKGSGLLRFVTPGAKGNPYVSVAKPNKEELTFIRSQEVKTGIVKSL